MVIKGLVKLIGIGWFKDILFSLCLMTVIVECPKCATQIQYSLNLCFKVYDHLLAGC